MKLHQTKFQYILLFCFFTLLTSCIEEYDFILDENLKDAATFPVGVATQTRFLQNDRHTEVVEAEFNSITAEFEMKQNIIGQSSSSFNWTESDSIVEYANRNGMRVHGHALIWHNAVPSWIEDFQGSNEAFEETIKDYIQTVVSRYKGKVASWDVVNEAFEDSGNDWRETVFRERMGEDYIEKCFQWAREVDEDVLLFYNDFNLASSASKIDAVIKMVEDFKARNIPIDGVGMQMHIGVTYPRNNKIQDAVDKLVATDLKIHFSEVDIRTNFTSDNRDELSDKKANQQAAKMQTVVEIYNSIPVSQQFGITVWGLRDIDSWIPRFFGRPDWVLLFDDNYERKLMYQGFLMGVQD